MLRKGGLRDAERVLQLGDRPLAIAQDTQYGAPCGIGNGIEDGGGGGASHGNILAIAHVSVNPRPLIGECDARRPIFADRTHERRFT